MFKKDEIMKKKILLGIIIVFVVLLIVQEAICIKRQIDIKNENNEIKKDSKVLVVYYSAQGHTDNVAKQIANNLNADIFAIEPVQKYTIEDLDWTNKQSRSTIEM